MAVPVMSIWLSYKLRHPALHHDAALWHAVQGGGLLRNSGAGAAAECPLESLWPQYL